MIGEREEGRRNPVYKLEAFLKTRGKVKANLCSGTGRYSNRRVRNGSSLSGMCKWWGVPLDAQYTLEGELESEIANNEE